MLNLLDSILLSILFASVSHGFPPKTLKKLCSDGQFLGVKVVDGELKRGRCITQPSCSQVRFRAGAVYDGDEGDCGQGYAAGVYLSPEDKIRILCKPLRTNNKAQTMETCVDVQLEGAPESLFDKLMKPLLAPNRVPREKREASDESSSMPKLELHYIHSIILNEGSEAFDIKYCQIYCTVLPPSEDEEGGDEEGGDDGDESLEVNF